MSTATRPAAPGAPHAADNGCTGYTDHRDAWHPCESPPHARMYYKDQCRECHAKLERADELRAGILATVAPAPPAETPQRGEKEGTAFACVGYDDAEGHHRACVTPDQRHLAKGMCRKCYAKNASAKAARREAGADLPAPLVVAAPVPPPAPPRGEWRPDPEFAPVSPDEFGGEDAPPAPAAASLAPDWREQPPAALAAAVLPPSPAKPYAWTVFDQPPHITVPTAPTITLAKDGGCRLNSLAYALWGREVAAVEVLYDKARRAVALRPCDPALPHARRLRTDKGSRHCSLRAFRRFTGLLTGGTVAVVPRLVAPDLIVFDLPQATEPGR